LTSEAWFDKQNFNTSTYAASAVTGFSLHCNFARYLADKELIYKCVKRPGVRLAEPEREKELM